MSWASPLTALSHLSDEAVAAFADGVLSDSARQRAQSHMAGCGECSDAVYGQRAARAALRRAPNPSLPVGLFERLRELPITAELPAELFPSALSIDGEPLFAPAPSGKLVAPAVAVAAAPPLSAVAAAVAPSSAPFRSQAHRPPAAVETGHRRASTRVGLGATAAAVLAVGVLATTAGTVGGAPTPNRTLRPAVDAHEPTAAPTGHRAGEPVGPVRAPMQMTLLSVPATGR